MGLLALTYLFMAPAQAHRSGCHRWHSCPSDRGTYECGDLGYTTYCGTGAETTRSSLESSTLLTGSVDDNVRYTKTKVNLRSGPSTQSTKIAVMNPGVPVTLQGCASGWCRVTVYNGYRGYVSQQYLRR